MQVCPALSRYFRNLCLERWTPISFIALHLSPFKTISVQSLSYVWLFATPWTAARQASLSISNPWSLLKLMSIKWWCHPTISSSVILFSSHLQSCPALGLIPKSQFFASGAQVLELQLQHRPSNEYSFRMDWLDLLTEILLRDSQESSPTPQFKSINSLAFSFLYGPTLTFIHDYWKNHSFD